MYIQIKTADCSQNKRVEVSKLTSVKELKSLVENVLNVKPERQRLFFRGKQLEDDYNVFDYSINVNDVVMLMVKPDLSAFQFSGGSDKKQEGTVSNVVEVSDAAIAERESTPSSQQASSKDDKMVNSNYFKIGDPCEAIYELYGAWFEGRIVDIVQNSGELLASESSQDEAAQVEVKRLSSLDHAGDHDLTDDGLTYMVSFDFCLDDPPIPFCVTSLRPHMNTKLGLCDIKVGDVVLVNYNIESPSEMGFWYDLSVTSISNHETCPELMGTLYVGRQRLELKNCKVPFTNDVFKILKPQLVLDRNREIAPASMIRNSYDQNKTASTCSTCKDNPKRKCKECACHACGGKDEPNRQIMCDECNMAYHLRCLKPPLDDIPDVDEWYCPLCKNDENEIVKAGDKLKKSKKKKNLPSSKTDKSKRDWGKGMACAGRTKECTIVPPNHFGPIPGVDVGTCWKFRLTASEAGVHRPPVAGIHGRDNEGAYSIVLSGGYEDDVDNGDEFYYTGSGGRDLSGNKRTSEQSSDQTLTRMNLALAINCNAPVDKEKGADAKDWRGGKPVRVLRNYKLAKHSKYAPEEGNRYDGIYKVVKYYPEKGESGFIVWRYLLRRDDPTPAPWTEAGKKLTDSLGLTMIFPDGYEEMVASKEASVKAADTSEESSKSKKRPRKGILSESTSDCPNKKLKVTRYDLDCKSAEKIAQDTINQKLWDFCKTALQDGKMKFLAEVQQQFMCICCQELVCDPVTTICHHNICKACLKRSFSAQVYSCPSCRQDLGKQFELTVNENLSSALLHLFPGYTAGR